MIAIAGSVTLALSRENFTELGIFAFLVFFEILYEELPESDGQFLGGSILALGFAFFLDFVSDLAARFKSKRLKDVVLPVYAFPRLLDSLIACLISASVLFSNNVRGHTVEA